MIFPLLALYNKNKNNNNKQCWISPVTPAKSNLLPVDPLLLLYHFIWFDDFSSNSLQIYNHQVTTPQFIFSVFIFLAVFWAPTMFVICFLNLFAWVIFVYLSMNWLSYWLLAIMRKLVKNQVNLFGHMIWTTGFTIMLPPEIGYKNNCWCLHCILQICAIAIFSI